MRQLLIRLLLCLPLGHDEQWCGTFTLCRRCGLTWEPGDDPSGD